MAEESDGAGSFGRVHDQTQFYEIADVVVLEDWIESVRWDRVQNVVVVLNLAGVHER